MERTNPRPVFLTGVPGLDEVLGGGLRAGGLYLLYGPAGSGKTILAAQIGFGLAGQGERVLIVTLVSESHGKLLDHLSAFEFFDESLVGKRIVLLNGYESLQEKGPHGLLELLISLARECSPRLLIVEGFGTLRAQGLQDMDIARFVHQLNSLVTTLGCTALLIEPGSTSSASPEQSLVDGIVELGTYASEGRVVRELRVQKLRGSNPLLGRSFFSIGAKGIAVYPRLEEAVGRRARPAPETHDKGRFGVEHLDAMTEGGIVRGATSVLLGAPGSGKTLLGLKYLEEGLRCGEKALYFGFYESPARLVGKADGVGIRLAEYQSRGAMSFVWQPALEFVLDELGYKLLDAVRTHKPRRVLIDGIDAFHQSAIRKDRLAIFLTALMVELRSRQVDLLFTQELRLLQQTVVEQLYLTSAVVENILLLRYVERGSELRRLISILKMRESGYDTSIREFAISAEGLAVAGRPAEMSRT